jgi:hypothetical protein
VLMKLALELLILTFVRSEELREGKVERDCAAVVQRQRLY